MQIKLTDEVIDKINRVSNVSYWNSEIDKNLYAYIIKGLCFPKPHELYDDSKDFQRAMEEHTYYYSDDEAVVGSAIYSILNSVIEDEDEYIPAEILAMIIRSGKIMHKEDCDEYHKDSFLKNVKLENVTYGDKIISPIFLEPYTMFEYDNASFHNGLYIPKFALSTKKLYCPTIQLSNGDYWETVTPRVVRLCKPYIKHANGDVLVLGNGLGYFPYMISSKKNVKSITIVERDEEVLELFKRHILPQFKYKEKVTIICADPIEYLENVSDGQYHYCFADLWQWEESDSIYITAKALCKHFKKMQVEYWLEDDFIQTIASCVSEIIEVQYSEQSGEPIEKLGDYTEYEQFVVDYLENMLENYQVRKPSDIDKILNPEELKEFLTKYS